jgi:hypothetical protein
MKCRIAATIAFVLFFGAASAGAETFTPKPNMVFDLEPIAPEGSFSTWTATDLKGLNALRTRAAFGWFGRDPKWAPGFKIALRSGPQEVMLSVGGQAGRPMTISLETVRSQKLLGSEEFKLAPDSNDEIELQIYWSDSGEVTAIVGKEGGRDAETHKAKLERPPEDLSVYVSTASVRLVPFRLGVGSP